MFKEELKVFILKGMSTHTCLVVSINKAHPSFSFPQKQEFEEHIRFCYIQKCLLHLLLVIQSQ